MHPSPPVKRATALTLELSRRPSLDEIELICKAAEEGARAFLLSKISLKRITDLDVIVEATGDKPLVLDIEVGLELVEDAPEIEGLVKEATSAAFSAAELKVRELGLCEATPVL